MGFNFFSSDTEKSDNKKHSRGRPKRTDEENRSKRFNLIMKPSTLALLNKLAAQKQLQTGIRTSVTELINTVLEYYISKSG